MSLSRSSRLDPETFFPGATGEYSIFPSISNHTVLPTDGNQIGLQSDRTKNTLPRVLHDIWYMND